MHCDVYKSPKMSLAYLYLERGADPQFLPDELLASFGEPEWVLDVVLDAQRKLAMVAAEDVIKAVRDLGYFLQMPPPKQHRLHQQLRD